MATGTARAAAGKLVQWITHEEGLRLKPYRDTEGFTTIGIGRCLDTTGISKAEADLLLANDLLRAAQAVARLGAWTARLDEVRWAVLVAMAFQLGEAGLRKFRATLTSVEQGDYARAASHMLASKWARQTPKRVKRTAVAMATGLWPEGL